jgi:formate hydrogenlyase subunit 6/NADH:ubiquinone oxidoreductase subunit I
MIRPGRMLKEVLGSIFTKAATSQYPLVKIDMPKDYRGRIKFHAEKCIGCKLCMKDCPSDAIFIRKVGEKKFEADIYSSRCIFCAQCVDTCPKDALESTPEYELAQLDPSKLKVVHRAETPGSTQTPA